MKTIQPMDVDCGCDGKKTATDQSPKNKSYTLAKAGLIGLLGFVAWYIIYKQLEPFSYFFAYSLLGLEKGSHLGEAIQFFVYDTPKVMMLLTLIVFVIGILRSFFTQERTRKYLAGKRETAGNVMAALLGIVTPFCSCSAVPLFIGFVQVGVPLGVTFSYCRSDGQRDCFDSALRSAWLESCCNLPCDRLDDCHHFRLGHWPFQT